MLESNPPRNNTTPDHPDDEPGVVRKGCARIVWKDFPMPKKTHRESARSGLLIISCLMRLELGGRQVTERRVETLAFIFAPRT